MNRRVLVYVGLVCAAAVSGVALTDWGAFFALPGASHRGFVALLAIGLLSESLAIRLTVGRSAGDTSITFIPLLAGIQLFGPGAGVLLIAVTEVYGEFLVRKKDTLRAVFNLAQLTLATAAAGWVFTFLGGAALQGSDQTGQVTIASQIWPFVSCGLVFLGINHAAVSLAITLSQRLPFRRVWAQMLGHSGASISDVLISPIALAVAFLYVQFGIGGILVVILPMLFIRRSYLQTTQLREANRDLIKALVKAIETRDPHTSGHSVRVSFLARRITEELGVSRATIDRVETAALLHDIGKIDSIYSTILKKPAPLTAEERRVIQSHVTKGEELLRNLTSFGDDVALAVRHHHEREDGSGYPDGLSSTEIPLGARIIMVSDAIDAMLSDRPYRHALSPARVVAELKRGAGTQFNPQVVEVVIHAGILAEFATFMGARADPEEAANDLSRLLKSASEHGNLEGLRRMEATMGASPRERGQTRLVGS